MNKFNLLVKGFALLGIFGLLLSCGGGGGGGGGGGDASNTLDYHAAQIVGFKNNIDAVIDYAKKNGLNSFNVDALREAEPNFTETYIRKNYQDREEYANYLSGVNRIRDYTLTIGDAISVVLDPSKITYPADYEQVGSDIPVSDPYCNPKPIVSVFPKSFLGSHDLPTVDLTNNTRVYEKIAFLKDIWFDLYPSYITGCQDDVYEVWENTFSRLKQLNIDTVMVFPWASFDLSVTPWIVHPPGTWYTSTMDDDALAWVVGKAKEYGFKVIWDNQVQYFTYANGDPQELPAETVSNALKTFEAIKPYLENRASLLEQLGVDAMRISPWYWAGLHNILSPADYIAQTTDLLTRIKNRFSGDIIYEYDTAIIGDTTTNGLVDIYTVEPFTSIPEADLSQLSVEYLRPQLQAQWQAAATTLAGKPAIIGAFAPSYDLERYGYVETPFCTGEDPLDFTQLLIQCYQESIPTEFGMQAIIIEAILETALAETQINISGVAVHHWMDDNILPSNTFPNLAYSIRGKPSESIVYQWFR